MSNLRLVLDRPPRAVVFDYFGTLTSAVQRGPIHRVMAERMGCDADAWLDLLTATFFERATGRLGKPVAVLGRMAAELGGHPSPGVLAQVYLDRIRAIAVEGPLRPEATAVLAALRQRGLHTAVVSDCWYELPLLIRAQPVWPLLDAKVLSVEVGRCKPDPWVYRSACEQLGVDPTECLYVGDGDSHELTGAAAVGISAVKLAAPDSSRHLAFAPDLDWTGPTIGSLTDVLGLVDAAEPVPVR